MSASGPDALGVVHVDAERGWRGGERQTLWLAEWLARQGHRSFVATRPGEPLSVRALAAGLETKRCAPQAEIDPAAVWALRSLVRRERIHVVHAHTAHAVALGALAAAGTAARLVVTRRVDFVPRRNAFTRWKYRRASAVIAVSEAVRRALVAGGVDGTRITVVPDGIPLDRAVTAAPRETLAALGVDAGAPVVVMVAALVPHKDPLTFVRAMAVAHRLVPGAHALLVGDGPLRADVEREVARLALDGVVHLAGYRTDAEELLAAATVATLSSAEEGMGSVLLDAMAFGKPVAATAAGGIPDVVRDGETGLLVAPRDPDALGRAIAALLADPDRSFRMGAAGARRARDFSMDRTGRETLAVYERVLSGAAPR